VSLAMPDSPLKQTRLFGLQQRAQEQAARTRANNEAGLQRAKAACGSGRQLQAAGAACDLRKIMRLQRKVSSQSRPKPQQQRRQPRSAGAYGRIPGARTSAVGPPTALRTERAPLLLLLLLRRMAARPVATEAAECVAARPLRCARCRAEFAGAFRSVVPSAAQLASPRFPTATHERNNTETEFLQHST
jgi:hypothetical protein